MAILKTNPKIPVEQVISMQTQFDIPAVLDIYKSHQNYQIYDLNPNDDRCLIYFSSHAIYYPNDQETFLERIINGNRFEWQRNILPSVRRAILVRDVWKQWYLQGINGEINTIEKLYQFLKKETAGLKITCIGNSGGGYAATLFGCLLGAERVFNFSGQFYLASLLNTETERIENQLLVKYADVPEISQYYDLTKLLATTKMPVFYLYPAHCQFDIEQAESIQSSLNVYSFAFNRSGHGQTCYPINYLDLWQCSNHKLLNLSRKYQGRMFSSLGFSLEVSGWLKTGKYFWSVITKKIKKLMSLSGSKSH